MKKFEYTTIDVSTCDEDYYRSIGYDEMDYDNSAIDNLSSLLNEYGKDGWELVSGVPYNYPEGDDTYTTRVWYTFKREIN